MLPKRARWDKVPKGDPAPGTPNPSHTQHFSTSGRGHKGFPTWITAASPALMIMPRHWLSQGLAGSVGHKCPPQGRRETSQPATCAGNDALSLSFSPVSFGEKTLQIGPYLPPPRRANLSPKGPQWSLSVPGSEMSRPREQDLNKTGIKGPPVSYGGTGGEQWAGSDREWLCMDVCVPESHTQSQDTAPLSALPHGIYQPCHSGMVLFPYSVDLHLSPDENVPGFQQCLLCCRRQRGGVHFISISSPPELCPGRPPCFMLLPMKLIKINMFFVCIYWSGLQFG